MSISSISGASSPAIFRSSISNRRVQLRSIAQSTTTRRNDTPKPPETDPSEAISVAEPQALIPFDAARSLSSLKFRSRLNIRQSGDTTSLRFRSRLKFNYQFQADDGTTVKLSAKLKTNLSYKQTDDDSFELKGRVKLQLSVAFDSVNDGVSPALESGALTEEQGAALRAAVDGFGNLIDQLGESFFGGQLESDDLIGNLVDGFNEFVQGATENLLGGPDADNDADEPLVLPVEPIAIDTTPAEPPVAAPIAPPIETPPEVSDREIDAEDDLEDDLDVDEEAKVDNVEVIDDDDDSVEREEGVDATPTVIQPEVIAPAQEEPVDVASILSKVRLDFVESLSSLITVLDSPGSEADRTRTSLVFRQQSRLSFRLSSQTLGGAIDTEA